VDETSVTSDGASSSDGQSKPLATITAVFGLFAGLATLLTVLGGVALTVRFRSSGLPTEAIAGGLPTSFFLSIGLDVTLQLLIFAGLVAVAVVRPGLSRVIYAFLAAGVLAYPFTRTVTGSEWVWLTVAAFLSAFVVWRYARKLGRRPWPGDGWRRIVALLATSSAAILLALFVSLRFYFEWKAVDVLDAKACLAGNKEEAGLFIGENDSSVFIGVTSPGPARITEIPRDDVKRVFIGDGVKDVSCPIIPTTPPAPTSPPPPPPP
jgi:hypothetical protein